MKKPNKKEILNRVIANPFPIISLVMMLALLWYAYYVITTPVR